MNKYKLHASWKPSDFALESNGLGKTALAWLFLKKGFYCLTQTVYKCILRGPFFARISGEVRVKEDEVRIDNGRHELLLYVEKSDGSYGPVQTGAYMATNYMDDFVQKRKNLENECLEKLRNGEVSAVGYFMLLRDMTVADVAARVSLSKSRVKRHMIPDGFKKVSLERMGNYADVFGVPLPAMLQVITLKDANISVTFRKINNPYMSIMEIGRSAA